MFLVSDKLRSRHALIRKHGGKNIMLGVLLAVIDYEWTVRRAIIGLGYKPTKQIREYLIDYHSLRKYKDAWDEQVYPCRNSRLIKLMPDWPSLKKSFELRNKIVHGVKMTAGKKYAIAHRDCALLATETLVRYAKDCDVDLYDRLPIRRKEKAATQVANKAR